MELLHINAGVLRPDGLVLVIHWRADVETPRGLDLSIRPRPTQVVAWAAATQMLSFLGPPRTLPPWHFGVVLQRTD